MVRVAVVVGLVLEGGELAMVDDFWLICFRGRSFWVSTWRAVGCARRTQKTAFWKIGNGDNIVICRSDNKS